MLQILWSSSSNVHHQTCFKIKVLFVFIVPFFSNWIRIGQWSEKESVVDYFFLVIANEFSLSQVLPEGSLNHEHPNIRFLSCPIGKPAGFLYLITFSKHVFFSFWFPYYLFCPFTFDRIWANWFCILQIILIPFPFSMDWYPLTLIHWCIVSYFLCPFRGPLGPPIIF